MSCGPRRGIPCGSVVKNLPANAGDSGDADSIPGSGRSPGGRNGNPLQYSCLENPMDRGAWRATVHGVTESVQLNTVMGQGTFSRREPLLLPSEIYEAHIKRMAFQLNLKEEIFLRRKSNLSNLCWKALVGIVGHLGHCSCFKRLESMGERKHEIVQKD